MNLVEALVALVLISLATASVTLTISKADIFEWLRLYLAGHFPRLSKLVTCPYCLSHSVALFFTVLCSPKVLNVWWPINMITCLFATVTLSSFLMIAIYKSISSLGE